MQQLHQGLEGGGKRGKNTMVCRKAKSLWIVRCQRRRRKNYNLCFIETSTQYWSY